MAGPKNERRPPPAAPPARPGHARAVAMPEVCVASDDEEEAAALDADGEGVWDHAFCVVCDCLIETDVPSRHESELDEEEWAIAAMSSLRRHDRFQPAARSRPRRPAAARAAGAAPPGHGAERAPLFCSERCRQLDLQRSGQLGEFMNYLSRRPPHELRAVSLADRYDTADSPPRTGGPVPTAAKSLSTSLLRAETRISAAALADAQAAADAASSPPRPSPLDASPDMRTSPPDAELFRRRMSWQRTPRALASEARMPSNLTRARAVLDERASPEPSVSSSSMATDMLAGSPPRSVMLGSGTPLDTLAPYGASPRAAAPPTAQVAALSVSATPSTSPLSLLAGGTGHHAEPSVSLPRSRGKPLWDGTAAATTLTRAGPAHPSAAAELRRHAQGPRDGADSAATVRGLRRSSVASAATSVSGASASAARRRRTLLDPSPTRASDGGSASDTSVRDAVRRSRDVRVLPPLLGPAPIMPDMDSPRSLSQRGSTTDLASMGRRRSSMLSTSLQATSPRRAGLGWSAFSHAQPLPRPLERASPPEAPARTWSYEQQPGMRMYPIMQLPSAPVHDTYSHYWPPAVASTPQSAQSDTAARRKSLFHFDG